MTRGKPIDAVELYRDLDRIRDRTLEVADMCLAFSDYLHKRVGFAEAHVLVRNEETGAMENPNPERPRSDEVKGFIARHAGEGWKKTIREDKQLTPTTDR